MLTPASLSRRWHGALPWETIDEVKRLAMAIAALALGCDGGDERCRWEIELADEERIGGRTALAVGASGEVHVGYVHTTGGDRDVRHARRGEDGWTVERVDPGAYAGFDLSLAVDADGQVHLAYGDNSSPAVVAVRYSIRSGSGWAQTEPLAGGNATDQSLALDASGTAHVAFSGGASVHYAIRSAGEEWERVLIDRGRQPRLALDTDGRVHITYNDPAGGASILGHAVLDGGAWSTSVVDSGEQVGAQSAIAVGSDGSVHLAYRAGTTLRYAVHRGDWAIETVEVPGLAVRPTIAIDAVGAAHILYNDGDGVGLYHARLVDGTWATQLVDRGDLATADISNGTLVSDATGALHASYSRATYQENRMVNHPWYARLPSCDPP